MIRSMPTTSAMPTAIASASAQRRDADHDRHEDDRSRDGLDQLDEGVGEPLGVLGGVGRHQAEDDAGGDRHQHEEPQLRVQPAAWAILGNFSPGHCHGRLGPARLRMDAPPHRIAVRGRRGPRQRRAGACSVHGC
jgi:hypothetical protein